jgi:hypothetical protein
MKNFSELLATKFSLEITVNGQQTTADLNEKLVFRSNDTVSVDNIEVLPRYMYLAVDGILDLDEPFYCWLHRVSGQGWLLTPQ